MNYQGASVPLIAIIGGGFCGVSTLIQLCRQCSQPLSIRLINKDHELAKGIAFSSYNENHLLNVAAGKMSVLPDIPGHFTSWVLSRSEYKMYHTDSLPELFLPRVIYGEYMKSVLEDHLKNIPSYLDVKIIGDEAVNIKSSGEMAKVMLKNGHTIQAHKVILATGNFVPADPAIENMNFYSEASGYFANPWTADAVTALAERGNVLIIGTGLTMVDNVLSIVEKGFTGKITAVSTKGFFPLSHKKTTPYREILDEIDPVAPLVHQYRIFKNHIRKVLHQNITGEVVVDAVRPLTQRIWLNLELKEKKSFIQHLRHLWGVARHRLPGDVHDKMTGLIRDGRLEIVPARLSNMEMTSEGKIKATILHRKTATKSILTVDRVINCTGPQTDIRKIKNELIRNLLREGLICTDEMLLGMNAQPDGTILNRRAEPSPFLLTLGSNLKGILWESTAVPELRMQAQQMAKKILSSFENPENEKILAAKIVNLVK